MTISRSPRVVSEKFPGLAIGGSPLSFGLSLGASAFLFRGLHVFQQDIEALKIAGPKPPVACQPSLQFLERRAAQGVDATLRVHAYIHQAGFAEHAQMLGDLGLAQTEAVYHVTDRAGSVQQQLNDLKSVGFG